MSFGTSPTGPSLLIPSNPAFSSVDSAPRGGILINVQRASEPTLSIDTATAGLSSSQSQSRRLSDPSSPIVGEDPSPLPSPSLGGPSNKSLKIRFAPLPDPRRPRSLSTGRNIQWTNQVDENGEERRSLSIKDHNTDESNDYAVADDDDEEDDERRRRYNDDDDDDDDGEGDDEDRKSRRWSKSMGLGSSWKGTKKLLTGKNPFESQTKEKEKDDISAYGQGAPLKKSVSTGGFIGSSPFRWTSETERKNTMQGTSPPTVTSLLSSHRSSTSAAPISSGHRRNSSLEPGFPSSYPKRSSSPSTTPIKLMNGRVYGSRRASEAAERQKQIREKNEPAFVEWGQGAVAQHTTEETGNKGFLGDNDDGGGMAWVKRRREERQKKEREDRERAQKEEALGTTVSQEQDESSASSPTDSKSHHNSVGLSSSQSSTSSLDLISGSNTQAQSTLKTPAIEISDLPPTPIIRVSDSDTIHSPVAQHAPRHDMGMDVGPKGERMTPTPPITSTTSNAGGMNLGHGNIPSKVTELVEERKEGDHVVQAMRIPSDSNKAQNKKSSQKKHTLSDPFGQDSPTNERGNPSESDDEQDDEGEEEDDGDFDDDEDEEIDDIRTTSSAAGVEVISRHK